MGNFNLTPEIWSMIFSFCTEPSQQDKQVPQPTLVKLLRVNSTFFSIAAPLLYRNVMIENLGDFLLGITRTGLPDDIKRINHWSGLDLTGTGNTKLPLLRCIRNLTIIPFSPNRYVNDVYDILYHQQTCYDQAKTVLGRLSSRSSGLHIQSLTIGSASSPQSKEIETVHSRFFSVIHSVRRTLLELFRPQIWTEYSPIHGYCFEPLRSDFTNVKRILPEVVNIYTTLEGTFPLVWGTLNRIIVRRKENTPVQGMPDMSVLMVNPETIPEELDMISNPRFSEDGVVKTIVYTIIRSTPPWLRRLNEGEQELIDEKTKIEIYGLERLIAPSDQIDDEHEPDDRKEESEMRALDRVENGIREGSNVTSDGRWMRSGKKAFSIGLSLDVDDQDPSGTDESEG
ncbi:uncharacterized protein L199_001692 [Kwoniella botswanensis]|uniref:uncharacterized protein n=1 Tax=Kwoniella botswanensis TaxID=1268659 RepID=UPI00315CA515